MSVYKAQAATWKHTSQSEAAKPEQVKNRAGGYVFTVDPASAIDRFLLLGTDRPTYYAKAADMTQENAKAVIAYASDPTTGPALVKRIVEISEAGRAPKNSPAIFALAIACSVGDEGTRHLGFLALNKVCRTATHLFEFVGYLDSMRGWGRAPVRAVANWYLDKRPDQIAYQAVKYRQRQGWTHHDVIRLSHPGTLADVQPEQAQIFDWISGRPQDSETLPSVIQGFEKVQTVSTGHAAASLIKEYNLPWEALPDAVINTPEVWEALVPKMGMTALMRNLSRVARLGTSRTGIERIMIQRLSDAGEIKKARMHPVNILVAMRTYASGYSLKGGAWGTRTEWTPNSRVVDALDKAFYDSFQYVEPTGKRILYALDVSGSMGAGVAPGLSARDVAAAMALSTIASGDEVDVVGFTSGRKGGGWNRANPISPLDLSTRRRLDDNVKHISGLEFGATDCALPATWAKAQGKDYDGIVIATDNESWAGPVHPFQALRDYRNTVGHRVAQIVVALTATDYSVADPSDPDSLDVVGFDSALPNLIAQFVQ